MSRFASSTVLAAAILMAGCVTPGPDRPPVEIFPEMDRQYKVKPQEEFQLFPDNRGSRPQIPGTVARGQRLENMEYVTGKQGNMYIGRSPMPLTEENLRRGQERFNIYCAPCHGATGQGNGIVPRRAIGWIPGNLQEDRILQFSDGELFDVISYGRRSMKGYAPQITADDRWAIVGYIRALQRAYHGTMEDVPADLQSEVR